MTPTQSRLQAFSALRYREYRLFWIGAVFSGLGIWPLMAGRLWLMNTLTDSTLMLGLVTFSSLGPILLLSMWGGVVADRVNRLKLVTITRALFSLIAFVTAALIYFEVVQPWHVIALALATGVLLSFDIPSRQAILPNLVDRADVMNAVVLYSFLFSGIGVISPALFAPMIRLSGLEGLFAFVGLMYAGTVVMLLMMKRMPRRRAREWTNPVDDLMKGLAYIWARPIVIGLIGIGIVAGVFAGGSSTLFPVFADKILKGGIDSYGYLLVSQGVGGLVGTVLLALLGNAKNSGPLQLVTAIGYGVALAVFARLSWLPASILVIGFAGAFGVVFMTINNSILQSGLDDEYRGRVMSIHQLGWGASAIGGLLMGWLAQIVSAPFALTLGGVVTAVATALMVTTLVRGRAEEPASLRPEPSTRPKPADGG